MKPIPLSPNFQSSVERMVAEDSAAVVLGWWRRVENVLGYYTVSHHGRRMPNAAAAEKLLREDGLVSTLCVDKVQSLRRARNRVAHEPGSISSHDAIAFACDALDAIWMIGDSVPNDLAIRSGAAMGV